MGAELHLCTDLERPGAFGRPLRLSFWATLKPRRPNPIKNQHTKAASRLAVGDTWVQFRAQYYLIGLIFLIFDVEVIFLFPIALAYQRLSLFGVVATITFVVILLLGLLLEWRKGALEWE